MDSHAHTIPCEAATAGAEKCREAAVAAAADKHREAAPSAQECAEAAMQALDAPFDPAESPATAALARVEPVPFGPGHAPRAILFDFDGTLANTVPGIVRIARQALTEAGLTQEQMGDLRRLVGPPFPYAFELLFHMAPQEEAAVTARYRELYKEIGPGDYPLYPGVRELLMRLKAHGVILAMATSRIEPLARHMASTQGILELFDVVVGQKDAAHANKPYIVGAALAGVAALGIAPQDALMVGDREYDVEGAHANGIPALGIYSGTAPAGELEEAGAEWVCWGHAQLGATLASWGV